MWPGSWQLSLAWHAAMASMKIRVAMSKISGEGGSNNSENVSCGNSGEIGGNISVVASVKEK